MHGQQPLLGSQFPAVAHVTAFQLTAFMRRFFWWIKQQNQTNMGSCRDFLPVTVSRAILSPFYGWRGQKDFWFLAFPESFSKCSSYSSGNGSCFVFLCDSAMHIHKGSSLLMICISITRLQCTDINLGKNGLRCSMITVQLVLCSHQRLLIFCHDLSGVCSSKQAYLRYGGTRNLGCRKRRQKGFWMEIAWHVAARASTRLPSLYS